MYHMSRFMKFWILQ